MRRLSSILPVLLLGLLATLPVAARAGAFQGVAFSAGAAAGVDEWGLVGSPVAATHVSLGGAHVRFVAGLHTAPTFLYAIDFDLFGVPAVALDLGVDYGGEVLRTGPYGFIGLATLGAGWRAAYTPFEDAHGHRHGVELRGAYLPMSTGQVAVLYTFRPRWGVRPTG